MNHVNFLLNIIKEYNEKYIIFNIYIRKLIRIFKDAKININYKIIEVKKNYNIFKLCLTKFKLYRKKIINILPDIRIYDELLNIKINKITDGIIQASLNLYDLKNHYRQLIQVTKRKTLYKIYNSNYQLDKLIDEFKIGNKENLFNYIIYIKFMNII